jgi:hypothetical protein
MVNKDTSPRALYMKPTTLSIYEATPTRGVAPTSSNTRIGAGFQIVHDGAHAHLGLPDFKEFRRHIDVIAMGDLVLRFIKALGGNGPRRGAHRTSSDGAGRMRPDLGDAEEDALKQFLD